MRILKITLLLLVPLILGAQCRPGPDPFTGLFVVCSAASAGPVGPAGAAGATGATGSTGATGAVGGSGYCEYGADLGATPTFNAILCNSVAGAYSTFTNASHLLTTNVTSANYSNLSVGLVVTRIYQSSSAAKTLSWGTVNGGGSVIGGCIITPVLSGTTTQTGYFDGTNLYVNGNCLNDETSTTFRGPTRTAPSTPGSGIVCWFDTTDLMQKCIDSSGQIYGMPLMTPVLATGITLFPPILNPIGSPILNETGTGTLTNGLARLSGGKAIKSLTTDTGGLIGICKANCTTSGTPTIITHGLVNCLFDSTSTTLDDYVVRSTTTDASCHDAGSSRPPLGQNLGRVLQAGAGPNAYEIWFEPDTAQLANTIALTGQTAAIGTATLCASAAGACNQAGQYRIDWSFIENGTACGTPGTGGVTFLLTWTSNAGTHSAVSLPMDDSASLVATSGTFTFRTTKTAAYASGTFTIQSTGAIIQYATGYTACSVGTGTYELNATVTRLQ